jgi:hypothetical protein
VGRRGACGAVRSGRRFRGVAGSDPWNREEAFSRLLRYRVNLGVPTSLKCKLNIIISDAISSVKRWEYTILFFCMKVWNGRQGLGLLEGMHKSIKDA